MGFPVVVYNTPTEIPWLASLNNIVIIPSQQTNLGIIYIFSQYYAVGMLFVGFAEYAYRTAIGLYVYGNTANTEVTCITSTVSVLPC